jgi:hypothetical protein
VQPALPPACRGCGEILDDQSRGYCNGCLPERRAEATAGFVASGSQTLAARRAEGSDSAHGGDAAAKRGRRNAAHAAAVAAWEDDPPGDELDFARDVLPRLQRVSLHVLAEATGLSEGYCSFVRRGVKTPHRRHWEVLARLAAGPEK